MSAGLPVDEILFDVSPGETRAALVSQGRLVELVVEREGARSLVGNIYLGRIGKLVASVDAAFVELGAGCAGFLPLDEARTPLDGRGMPLAPSRRVSEGEAVLVQVVKDGFGQKGSRLSTQLTLPGQWLVLTPKRPGVSTSRRIADAEERTRLEGAVAPHLAAGEGVILRTAAERIEAGALLDELATLRSDWAALLERSRAARAPALVHAEPDAIERTVRDHAGPALRRVVCDSREALTRLTAVFSRRLDRRAVECLLHRGPAPLFARHEIEEQIARALEPVVDLPSGGRLVIGALEALTAIDVDTARRAGGERFEDAVLAVNLEAADEIARQVRLRNIAGLIVIDFVHMARPAHRRRVIEALHGAFADDPAQVQLGGMTSLGLFEMTRKRVRESLRDLITASCDICHGAGRMKSAETVAYEVLRAAERAAETTPGRPLTIVAAAAVMAAFDGEAGPARAALEARLGRKLALRADPACSREQFDIVAG